jgi:5-dehydro-2-deoxygluconokinase
MKDRDFELICMGRSCVDLYGQQFGCPLEKMTSFSKFVGGSPMNIAIGSSRLGLKVAAITAVGNEHMGRFLVQQLAAEGVDTSQIRSFDDRLTALVILGIRDQDNFPMIQYREHCADMGLRRDHIDPAFIARAKALLVTGTHLSSPATLEATEAAMAYAKSAGCLTILDIDYRPNLWRLGNHNDGEARFVASDEVTRCYQSVLSRCDLIVGTEEEFHIAGGVPETIPALRRVREITSATLVCKAGIRGCVGIDGEVPEVFDERVITPGFPVEVYNSVGAGDGFMSGFLRGWLRHEDLPTSCRYANAAGAFAVSRLGCSSAYPSWEELSTLMEQGSRHVSLRKDARLNQLHWSTNRPGIWPCLCILAFDHGSLFPARAERMDCDTERLSEFTDLLFQAVLEVGEEAGAVGIIADDRYSRKTLFRAMDQEVFIARPIEQPGRPWLAFAGGRDVAVTLREWPRAHVVKCRVEAIPQDGSPEKALEQERVGTLMEACRATEHELMLELIASGGEPAGSEAVAGQMKAWYETGIYPDWWNLEPPADEDAWASIVSVLEEYDPYCRGILLSGAKASVEEFEKAVRAAMDKPWCKGFVVVVAVFHETAQAWLQGSIDDQTAQERIKRTFGRLADIWSKRRND